MVGIGEFSVRSLAVSVPVEADFESFFGGDTIVNMTISCGENEMSVWVSVEQVSTFVISA